MSLVFLPELKKLRLDSGQFALPKTSTVTIDSRELASQAKDVAALLGRASISVSIPSIADTVLLRVNGKLKPGGYRLTVSAQQILIEGASAPGVHYGVQTLRQLLSQSTGGLVPCLHIEDWPDFEKRGIYYDVCRGRVPKLERLKELAEHLSRHKINELQLYMEHTFRFRGHPDIGKGASPLSAEDILELDAFCHERHIELIPSLASFGHLSTVLKHPQYHHLTEDWAEKRYVAPDAKDRVLERYLPAWSLAPAVPESYEFLDSLFAEFLPLFRSPTFNVCCDETYDLGLGRSYELAQKIGKDRLYLNHILKLRDLAAKYGKRIMLWGDIIREYPEAASELPKDVTVLDWAYDYDHAFGRIRDFKKAGLPFYACPGTSSWVSPFARIHEAQCNIAGFAAAGKRNGALGLLTTDWGDGGHFNFMEYSWHGYMCGAEQGWNVKGDQQSFTARFCKLFIGIDAPEFTQALVKLGDVTHLKAEGYYQSLWLHLFFACPGEAVLQLGDVNGFSVCRGKIRKGKLRIDAALGKKTLKELDEVRVVLKKFSRRRTADPLGILSYWIFAVDTLRHAARKLTVLGIDGNDSPVKRKALKKEMTSLLSRFETLWAERNRSSEIRITRTRYQRVLKALQPRE